MANSADFESFLKNISPSKSTIDEAGRLHRNLREHLRTCDSCRNTHVDTYLLGSYANQTFIRPKKDSNSCDIDVIVETTHSISDSPYTVLCELEKAIRKRDCYQNTRIQTHSVGIPLSEGVRAHLLHGSADGQHRSDYCGGQRLNYRRLV